MDVWDEVARRRHELADAVDALEPATMDAPSWCGGWRARDVLGHLVHLAEATQLGVMVELLRAGGRPDRAMDRRARAIGARPAEELTARLRAGAGGRFHVLGSPAQVALGEVLVHGADMLRPLDAEPPVDPASVLPVLPVYRRIARIAFHARPGQGVRLVATDAEAGLGDGPEVRGRAVDLLLLLANRRQVLDDLDGPGVAVVRGRLG